MTETTQESLKVNGANIVVLELTVRDQRQWLKQYFEQAAEAAKAKADYDVVSWKLFDEVRLYDIAFMTDLTMEDLEDMTPSNIQKVVDVCKKVNPHFFDMRKRASL